MSRMLIIIGVVLIVMGLLWPLLEKSGLGRLPGDIIIERQHFRLYIPLTSAILVSLILSLVFWIFRR